MVKAMDYKLFSEQFATAVKQYSSFAETDGLVMAANTLHAVGGEQQYLALLLMKMLEDDDSNLQSILGDCYYQGRSVNKNIEKAVSLFREAANRGSRRADYDLAWYYYDNKEYLRAIEHFQRCISPDSGLDDDLIGRSHMCMGNAHSYLPNCDEHQVVNNWIIASEKYKNAHSSFLLALWYSDDDSEHFDISKSLLFYDKAATQGHLTAVHKLASFYMWGNERLGISKDGAKAEQILLPHKDAQDPDILRDLGTLYETGYGVRQDYPLAREYLEKAWVLDNHPHTAGYLGYVCYKLGDYVAAERWLEIADSAGVSSFSDFLGRIYKSGLVGQPNLPLARKYYEHAYCDGNLSNVFTWDEYVDILVNAGDYEQAFKVASEGEEKYKDLCFVYTRAKLVLTDKVINKSMPISAVEMMEICIERDYNASEASMILAGYYLAANEYRKAEMHYLSAFKNGIPDAAYYLAKIYERGGETIPENVDKAYEWYSKAANAGSYLGKIEVECFKKGLFGGYKRIKTVTINYKNKYTFI